MGTKWRQFTTAHYAAVISTLAFLLSSASFYVAKRSYDITAAKDARELSEKKPTVDIQMRPTGVSTLAVNIAILNRADVNISPLDVTAEHSLEMGSLYFGNAQQSIEKLSPTLSLRSMGSIAPKGVGTLKATLAGVTDGKFEQFKPGLSLEFTVRIRFADQQDTIKESTIVRRILAPTGGDPELQPTPKCFLMQSRRQKKLREIIRFSLS